MLFESFFQKLPVDDQNCHFKLKLSTISKLKYLENYAEAFDLAKHIVYQTKVVSVKAADHLGSGRWKVIVRDLDSNQLRSEEYDSVMICTGHFNRPIKPNFKGQDSFKGEIIHTQAYKNAERFGRKRVCVVGFGNSAVDAAVGK